MIGSEQILIICPNWIGDMVIAQSLFKYVKGRDQRRMIDVVAPPWNIPLLERMPEVRQVIELPVEHGQLGLMLRYEIGRQLRKNGYQWAITIPRSFKAALIPWFARVPRRSGYLGELRYGLLNQIPKRRKPRLSLMVLQYLALGNAPVEGWASDDIPPPSLSVDINNRQRVIDRLTLPCEQGTIALVPGAQYGPAKQWPIAYYAKLANHLTKNGFQVWVMGSNQDLAKGQQIESLAGNGVTNLCGRTSLPDVIDLMSCVSCVVSNDSGLMHIAAALNIPLVALFGSSSPDYTPPLGDEHRTRIKYLNLSCSPCFKRQCPLGHTNCLTQIAVADVLEAVYRLV